MFIIQTFYSLPLPPQKRVAPLKKAPQSEKQIAAREKREGARLRLREMRLATARRGREGNMEEEGGKEGGRREGCPEPIPEPHQVHSTLSIAVS